MTARFLFNGAAAIEVLTGIALLFAPAFVISLLLADGKIVEYWDTVDEVLHTSNG